MLAITRREGIVSATNRVGVPPLTMATLNAHFTATLIADNFLGGLLGFALGSVDAARTLCICAFYGPIIPVTDDVAIIL